MMLYLFSESRYPLGSQQTTGCTDSTECSTDPSQEEEDPATLFQAQEATDVPV